MYDFVFIIFTYDGKKYSRIVRAESLKFAYEFMVQVALNDDKVEKYLHTGGRKKVDDGKKRN